MTEPLFLAAGGRSHQHEHPSFSCISGPCHMIFSRLITDEEWKKFSDRVDTTWNGSTWDAEGMLALMQSVAPDIFMIYFEPERKKNGKARPLLEEGN